MTISKQDYLIILKELLVSMRYGEKQIAGIFLKLEKGLISLLDLSSNAAIQCFIENHNSMNSDIVRQYLKEYQKNKEVKFSDVV